MRRCQLTLLPNFGEPCVEETEHIDFDTFALSFIPSRKNRRFHLSSSLGVFVCCGWVWLSPSPFGLGTIALGVLL